MRSYRLLSTLVAPIIPLWLMLRRLRGKEDAKRLPERLGICKTPRPAGKLLWLHAASVGEATSILPLLQKVHRRYPELRLLLTTGTVTSARLMQKRLPAGAIHQFAPIDTPQATAQFIRHWRPDVSLWVESEFWPNLIDAVRRAHCYMGVINGRMSERSFQAWQKRPAMIRDMLACFDIVIAQSREDAARLQALGASDVRCVGNLKYDAVALPCDEAELLRLKTAIGARPVWLAASTHPGEEKIAAQTHRRLAAAYPDLLTIIAPRHPERGAASAHEIKDLTVALRSQRQAITPETQIYIADTMGELGLFYRLSEIAFMGGSLVNHGGQNPLEPARLSCGIIFGPHTHNFSDIYRELEENGGGIRIAGGESLAAEVGVLLGDYARLHAMQGRARQWVESQAGATDRLMDMLSPLFAPRKKS
ncbi:MAG: 3-deoxy-D-manno-octulosonic acid transferase [Pseudomonadota bacterium]|nr:3-deoxy-D-manno-octulosonic acid transferase [Pseudomonadota bacterium]MDE3037349.1 3-deoxy-D-manno-octulosonic acid transferase [Pseudomonadota bacterium]